MKRLGWSNTAFWMLRLWQRLRRNLNEDQSIAEWVRFQMFSARRTVDLKTRRVEVNQGLDLDFQLENLVITGACLSSRKDNGIISHHCQSGESQFTK